MQRHGIEWWLLSGDRAMTDEMRKGKSPNF